MTNSSPPNPTPPSEEQRIRQQIRRRTREETVDEWLAILIAFGTIGAILLWTLGFRKNNFVTTRLGNDSVASSGEQVVENFNINREVNTDIAASESQSKLGLLRGRQETKIARPDFSSDNNLSFETDSNNLTAKARNSFGAIPLIGAIGSGIGLDQTDTKPQAEVTTPQTEVEATAPEAETGTDIVPKIEATEPEVADEPEVTTEPEPEAATEAEAGTELEPEVATEAEAPTTPEPEVATEPEVADEPGVVVSFDDVQEGYWAYPFLQELGKQKLLRPTFDNNFEPDAKITRAGMATLISQAFKQSPTLPTKDFTDIVQGNTIAKDVDKAVGIGFMKGYSKDEFRPGENIPRYQVLVALATGLGLRPSGDPVTILQGFSDRDEIPNWAIPQVAAATEAGLAVNRPGFELDSLKPETPATRAEVAAMIYQTLKQQNIVPTVESENIVQP